MGAPFRAGTTPFCAISATFRSFPEPFREMGAADLRNSGAPFSGKGAPIFWASSDGGVYGRCPVGFITGA